MEDSTKVSFFEVLPSNQRKLRLFLFLILFYCISLVTCANVFSRGGAIDGENGDKKVLKDSIFGSSSHVMGHLDTMKQSQEEIFRKIEALSNTLEEKDHEDHQFRVKFSRKVHTLEDKVSLMELTFSQKVDQLIQKKVDEFMISVDNKLHYLRQQISGSYSENSHGSGSGRVERSLRDDIRQPVFQPYQNRYQPSHQFHPYHYHQPNWAFYEHPITQKRVRDSQAFGYHEVPTRDLPFISLVASTVGPHLNSNRVKGEVLSQPTNVSKVEGTVNEERDVGQIETKFLDEAKRKIESFDMALEELKQNVTIIGREIRSARQQGTDNNEVHRLMVDTKKEIAEINRKHQEMVERVEQFTVEIEKTAARREHSVNSSMREIASELRKQIAAVKVFAKKQVQNITATVNPSVQQSDKFRCAQTLLDELLEQLRNNQRHPSQLIPADALADQANSEEESGRVLYSTSGANSKLTTEKQVMRELETQKKDILALKADIGRLNISQVLLRRTVDEETLKRTVRPRDCMEIRLLRNASSGVYSIFPRKNDLPTEVYCDMTTEGGGWTVIQRRGVAIPPKGFGEERESFARNWDEYEKGFGSLHKDFWLGLSNIAVLCQLGVQELRIELVDWSGETRFANYQYFKVANATQLYSLRVKGYSGNAGDSLSRHNGMSFSTPDRDNDVDPRRHCGKTYLSGWWYYACFESNLNGLYTGDNVGDDVHGAFGTGIIWNHWLGNSHSLKAVEMKIRNRFI